MRLRIRVMGIVIGAYLLGFGVLAGVVIDRMWFDHRRSEVLERYEQALRHWQAQRMAFEKDAAGRP